MSAPVILVVDDDASVRRSLARLLGAVGYRTETFESGEQFLARGPRADAACVLLDLQMPGMGGLELQERLLADGHALSIVFLTGHGDVPSSVRAMKGGAVDFLLKPYTAEELVAVVEAAVRKWSGVVAVRDEIGGIRQRWETLTPREREVLSLVVTGLLNKQVAARLGTSEKTVKAHRARVMEKMEADSFAHLVRLAEKLEDVIPPVGEALGGPATKVY